MVYHQVRYISQKSTYLTKHYFPNGSGELAEEKELREM